MRALDSAHRSRAAHPCFAAVLPLVLGLVSVPAAAQYVIPAGRESVVLEAVHEAFGDKHAEAVDIERDVVRARTADGLTLVGWRGAEVQVDAECGGECSLELRSRWDPVAARLRSALDARADRIWQPPSEVESSAPTPRGAPLGQGLSPVRVASYLLLGLLAIGVLVAPRPWPAGTRRDAALALVLVLGFFIAALLLGDPRPLHDHLCNLERARCAANAACDEVHGAWGRPTFHVMGVILRAVPHRLPWVLGVGALLTSTTFWLVYDVTARVASRVGVPAGRAGEAGLWAVACVALHPGVVRVAGAGSLWPLTLLLTFVALHLVLRVSPASREGGPPSEADPPSRGRVLRTSLGIVGAGAAFTLALGGSRIALVLAPLVVLAPWAWRSLHRSLPLRLAALVAGLAPLAYFASSAHDVLSGDAYGARSSFADAGFASVPEILAGGALSPSYTSVLIVPLLIVAVCSRGRVRGLLPLAYAFASVRVATLYVVQPLSWDAGYPDAYLKHFPELVLAAPVFGIGALVTVRFLAARFGAPRLATALAACALVASVWAPPDARRLLFAHRAMERELVGLTAAFEALPPHDLVVFAPLVPRPEGMSPEGDPLEMHFPTGLYREALEARGQRPGAVLPLDALDGTGTDDRRILLYVGSTLRTFYPAEVAAGLVPDSFERPELRALRDRYTLEPVHLFSVPTDSPGGIDHPLAAGRVPAVELGFYRLTRR